MVASFTPEQYERNFTFLFYGLAIAWLVLLAFVGLLASRERKLRREFDRLKLLLGENR